MIELNAQFPTLCRSLYLDNGFTLVEPGTPHGVKLGLRLKDWHPDTFIARKDDLAMLPLLRARKPGSGSFTKLLIHLDARGLAVVISLPTGRFRDYLERTGWHMVHDHLWMR